MTLLEAVNLCLRSIGESNVLTINTNHPKHQTILSTLDLMSKQEQAREWWFNSGIRDLPVVSGEVPTTDYTDVRPVYRYQDFYPSEGRLVDQNTGEPIVIPVKAQVRWEYATTEAEWDKMPSTFTAYVAAKGALAFAASYDADQAQLQLLTAMEKAAKIALNADNTRHRRVNLFMSGSTGPAINRAWGQRYPTGQR